MLLFLAVKISFWPHFIKKISKKALFHFQARFPSVSPVRFTSSRSAAYNRAYFVSFKAKTGIFSVGVKWSSTESRAEIHLTFTDEHSRLLHMGFPLGLTFAVCTWQVSFLENATWNYFAECFLLLLTNASRVELHSMRWNLKWTRRNNVSTIETSEVKSGPFISLVSSFHLRFTCKSMAVFT